MHGNFCTLCNRQLPRAMKCSCGMIDRLTRLEAAELEIDNCYRNLKGAVARLHCALGHYRDLTRDKQRRRSCFRQRVRVSKVRSALMEHFWAFEREVRACELSTNEKPRKP